MNYWLMKSEPEVFSISDLRLKGVANMVLLKRGRLSVQPVMAREWDCILMEAA